MRQGLYIRKIAVMDDYGRNEEVEFQVVSGPAEHIQVHSSHALMFGAQEDLQQRRQSEEVQRLLKENEELRAIAGDFVDVVALFVRLLPQQGEGLMEAHVVRETNAVVRRLKQVGL